MIKLTSPSNSEYNKKKISDLKDIYNASKSANPFYHPKNLKLLPSELGGNKFKIVAVKNGFKGAYFPYTFKWGLEAYNHKYCFLNNPIYTDLESLNECLILALKISPTGSILFPKVTSTNTLVEDFYSIVKPNRNLKIYFFNTASRAGYTNGQLSTIPKTSLRNIKKLEKKRALLSKFTLNSFTTDDTDYFINQFLKLESGGWKGKLKTDFASSQSCKDYFINLIRMFHEDGHLSLHLLEDQNDCFGATCTFYHQDQGFRFKTSYNENFSKCSPGAILELDTATYLKSLNIKQIDSCSALDAENMNRVYPDKITTKGIIIVDVSTIRGKFVNELIKSRIALKTVFDLKR